MNSRFLWLFVPFYVAGGLFLIGLVSHEQFTGDLAALGFGFGDAIAHVGEHGHLPDATRNPLIPYSLALVRWMGGNLLVGLLIKNLVGQSLFVLSVLIMIRSVGLHRAGVIAIAFVLTFPQVFRHSFSLIPEEGWIIPLLALLTAALLCLDLRKAHVCLLVGSVCAALYLLKSSMAALAIMIPVLVAANGRSWRRTVAALSPPAIAIVAWSFHNLAFTGEMNPGNSMSGYDFLKGNYHDVVGFFPIHSLDEFSYPEGLLDRGANETEWAWSRRLWSKGVSENVEYPIQALQLLGLRVYQILLDPLGQDPSRWAPPHAPGSMPLYELAKIVGIVYMLAFRAILIVALIRSVAVVARKPVQSMKAVLHGEAPSDNPMVANVYFLALFWSFALPYLVAWGTERRIIPLVPVVVWHVWATVNRRSSPRRS